jgi:hypothetical protein
MNIYKKSGDNFIRLENPAYLSLVDGRVVLKSKNSQWTEQQVINAGHYIGGDTPIYDALTEKLGDMIAEEADGQETGYVYNEVIKKTVDECKAEACQRVCDDFTISINNGLLVSFGYTMQCGKHDFEMLHSGLTTALESPDYANNDDSYQVPIVDKDDDPHTQTIAEGLQIEKEIRENYWTLWNLKANKRGQVNAIISDTETTDAEKIAALVLI